MAAPSVLVDRYPNFSFGEVQIQVDYPGASPPDVERLVTQPIEDSLRDMPDLEFVKGESQFNRAGIHVKFVDDSDYEALYDELRLRVLSVQNRLPVVNGKPLQPFVSLIETDEWLPVIQASLVVKDPFPELDVFTQRQLSKELRKSPRRLAGGEEGRIIR